MQFEQCLITSGDVGLIGLLRTVRRFTRWIMAA